MRPNDAVAVVSIVSDTLIGITFWSLGQPIFSIAAWVGSVIPVLAIDYYEDRKMKRIINLRPPKVSPLDYAEAQDLAKKGDTKEAFMTLLLKAYPVLKRNDIDKMSAEQVRKLLDKIQPA